MRFCKTPARDKTFRTCWVLVSQHSRPADSRARSRARRSRSRSPTMPKRSWARARGKPREYLFLRLLHFVRATERLGLLLGSFKSVVTARSRVPQPRIRGRGKGRAATASNPEPWQGRRDESAARGVPPEGDGRRREARRRTFPGVQEQGDNICSIGTMRAVSGRYGSGSADTEICVWKSAKPDPAAGRFARSPPTQSAEAPLMATPYETPRWSQTRCPCPC